MCEPVSLALGALAVGTKVASTLVKNKADKKTAQANRLSAARAFAQTVGDIESRRDEEARAAMQAGLNAEKISMRETGDAQANAAEGGVTGSSADAVLAQLARALLAHQQSSLDNLKIKNKQLDRQVEDAAAGATSRIAANPNPNTLATGLSIGSDVAFGLGSLLIPKRK